MVWILSITLYLTPLYYLAMPTHRTTDEVDTRLWKYAWNHNTGKKMAGFYSMTFNDALDELLKEVGY